MNDIENPTGTDSEDVTLTGIPRIGRRIVDKSHLTFPIAISKIAIWMLGSLLSGNAVLLAYLCLSSVEHGKILTRMDERDKAVKEELHNLHERDLTNEVTLKQVEIDIKEIQLQAAAHGWIGRKQ